MKQLLLLFFALALVATVSAQKPEAIAIKAKGMGLNVDGVLDEAIWTSATKYNVTTPFKAEQIAGGATDCSGFFQVAWSDQGLYVAVTVTDDISQNDKNKAYGPDWANDMVEIYLDVNAANLNDGKGVSAANSGHFQNAGIAINGVSKWRSNSSIAYKMNGASYIKETFMSWSDMKDASGKVITPNDTLKLGFDIYLVDNDRDTLAKARNFRDRLVWSNIGGTEGKTENYSNMNDAGILKFDSKTVVDNPFVVTAPKLKGLYPNVDGVLNESIWAQVPKMQIQQPYKGESFTGATDCSAYFQTIWNEQGLFVAVTVTDDVSQNDKNTKYGPDWANDMVEIYLDVNAANLKDAKGPSAANSGHFQNAGIAIDGTSKWRTNSSISYKMTGTSYVKETFMSWSDMKDASGKVITPSDTLKLGFDIYVVDNDRDTLAKTRNFRDRLVWSNAGAVNENYSNMNDAGILKFDTKTVIENPALVTAPKLSGLPLNVDGVLDESIWAQVPKNQIQQPYKGESFTGSADCSAYFQTLWNEQGLYVAVTVTDDVSQNDKNTKYGPDWANDMVEIYLDVNTNLKDAKGPSAANSGHYQNAGIAIDGISKWRTNSSIAYKMNGTSYVKETFMSWADMKDATGKQITISDTLKLGFDIYVVDNDRDTLAKARNFRDRLVWSNTGAVNENYSNMNDAGILKLDTKTIISNPAIVTAPKLTGLPLDVDGVLAEAVWAKVPKVQIQQPYKGESFTGTADCSGYFQTLWSEQGLYVAVTVTDDISQNDKNSKYGPDWANDMVEIYLDMNANKKDAKGPSVANSGHYQNAGIAIDGISKWGTSSSTAYKLAGTSYVKEVFLNWTDLKDASGKVITPADTLNIGFDIYVVDNDRDTLAKARNFRDRLVWSNTGAVNEDYSNMNDAGTLKLDMKTIYDNPAMASVSKVTGDTIVVNGILDESVWASAAKVQVLQPFKGESFTGAADCSGFFQTVWNEKGLYVAVTVTDDISQNDKNSKYGPEWANDMVEIYFDMNAVAKDSLGSSKNLGHYGITGIAIDGTSKWGTTSAYAYKLTGASYVKESFFAWSDLKDKTGNALAPKADAKFGFDVYLIDNDRDTLAKTRNFRDRLVWSNKGMINENYGNMNDAGTLVLAAAEIANVFEYTEPVDTTNTGINNSLISNVLIYPNPAKTTVYVKNVSEKAQIAVYSLDGKMMLKSTGKNPINIQPLKKGIYMVKVKDGVAIMNKRLVVQ